MKSRKLTAADEEESVLAMNGKDVWTPYAPFAVDDKNI